MVEKHNRMHAQNTSYLSVASLLGAISKGMQAVILCTNRILQILNWRCQLTQIDLYNIV